MKINDASTVPDNKDFFNFLTYAVCLMAVGIGITSLGPLLPFLANNADVSIGMISFAFTAQNLGYLVGSTGGGRLFDRFNSHRLMIFSLVLVVVMGLLIPLISWFYLLLIVLFFFGLGFGTIDVGANVNLVWIYKSKVSPYMNALHFAFGLGGILAPIIITRVMAWMGGNLTWAVWALVILYLPAFAGLLTLKSPKNTSEKEALGEEGTVNYRFLIPLLVVFFLAVGVQLGFGGWLFTYVSALQIADVATAALMTSVFWGFLTLGRLIAIPVSKKVAPALILVVNLALTVLVLGLILIWPMSPWMMWVGSAGLGLAISSTFPTLLSFSETKMVMTGKVTGMLFLGSSLGMMFLPMMLGQVYEYIGAYQIMVALFAVAALGFAIMLLIISDKFEERNKS